MPRISTHILDIAKGTPAAGISVELHFGGNLIHSSVTNQDGRATLLAADLIPAGTWELIFHVEEYLQPEPFFDRITLRFIVTDEAANYHVPLLLAPHGYSTYRGS
jgi:5-hydroxyisourate hydrolase